MQKLILITLELHELRNAAAPNQTTGVRINELPQIDTLLEQGWQIEEYKVIHTDAANGALVLSVLLNDGADPDDPLYEFDEEDLDLE